MLNVEHHLACMRALIVQFEPSAEREAAQDALRECEMWLRQCKPGGIVGWGEPGEAPKVIELPIDQAPGPVL